MGHIGREVHGTQEAYQHLHLEAGQGGAGGGRRELQAGGQGGKVERGVPPEKLRWEDANQGADGGLQATGGFRNQVRDLFYLIFEASF